MPELGEPSERVAKAEASGQISSSAAAAIRRWLTEKPFEKYRPKLVEDLEAGRWKVLDDAFYAVIEFGTGGRRGRMYPVGTNVLNERTIAESARGLADYITRRKGANSPRSCVIARDTRHNSKEFAELCARVLTAAGFKVYLFPEHRSTPLLSTAVRELGCDAGIMITASHNPPSDNGFKCYAGNGGQVVPPDDAGIIACVAEVSSREIPEKSLDEALADGSLELVGHALDAAYINAVLKQSVGTERGISIVYTPMHGVGETSVAAALSADGFDQLNILASQRTPSGDFPNVPGHVSNPEIPRTLTAAIHEAKAVGADLVLASDPDADRIGVGLPVTGDPKGEWTTLDGNQIGVLLAAYVLDKYKESGRLREGDYMITTLVTTQMVRALATQVGVRVEDDLLVGFKWIGLRMDEAGPDGFLFGFEESHGYLRGAYARDKDAAVGAMLFAELTAELKAKGRTVLSYLDELYRRVGHHGERLVNRTLEGREGSTQIKKLMAAFRENPPKSLGGFDVVESRDYRLHERRDLITGERFPLPKPSGDMVIFGLDHEGARFAVRPSGTEPKIKFYLFARTEVHADVHVAQEETRRRLDRMSAELEEYIHNTLASAS